jgi:hypothetical protein
LAANGLGKKLLFLKILDFFYINTRKMKTHHCFCFLSKIVIFLMVTLAGRIGFAQGLTPVGFPVFKQDRILSNPWVGGFNNPQFSFFDISGDGQLEMVIFDRSSETISVFELEENQWKYHAALSEVFPALRHFVLVRDLNGDGVPDIFTYANPEPVNGISIFKGLRSEEGNLSFQKMDLNGGRFPNVLHFYSSGVSNNLYLAPTDIPVVKDLDGDGDLDILAFEPSGGRLWYYRNLSIERDLPQDSFYFIREDACWGKFIEGPDFDQIKLSDSPDQCAQFLQGIGENRHAGSNILAYDFSGNGLNDLLITDIDVADMKVLLNNGTQSRAWITQIVDDFPLSNPVQIPFFPAAFLAPSKSGDFRDIIVSPGADSFGSEDVEVAWYYEANIGENMDYTLLHKDYVVSDVLDFGTGTAPAIADVTGNGLMDIVVGVHSRFDPNRPNGLLSYLVLVENIGTQTQPSFRVADEDWLGLSQLGDIFFGFSPAFGDLDGDGDLDLLLGTSQGDHILLENIASPGRRMRFAPPQINPFSIPMIRNGSPCIVDLDGDGISDLLMGDFLGQVHYFRNQGTEKAASFEGKLGSSHYTPFFASIDVRDSPVPGYASPHYFVSNGTAYLALGRREKGVLLYQNGNRFDSYFSKGSLKGSEYFGKNTRLALHDFTDDGYLEMVAGNIRGGLQIVKTPFPASKQPPQDRTYRDYFSIFPNPADQKFYLNYENAQPGDLFSLDILDLTGAVMMHRRALDLVDLYEIEISDLPSGIYVVLLYNERVSLTAKIVISR